MKVERLDFDEERSSDKAESIKALFLKVFSDSEGDAEGLLVSTLAYELVTETDKQDIYVFTMLEAKEMIGCIVFSRLTFEDKRNAFILSPVAICTDYQGQGVGQKLINFGIKYLKENGVELVMTYGDIKFYSKVGFKPVAIESIQPPFALEFPEGWIGQSLVDGSVNDIFGNPTCVKALNKAVYW